ncbi:MAG: thioredoxin domain-containing protein, partial [Planctomycetota bacterium]
MSGHSSAAPRNRLRDSLSPYLLQHASNPVDWYPWGEEALARSKKEDRPIFLSIGYAACHWCHVMERESFEHPGIARFMNENFVNIKVDREERPDIDEIYMSATLAISGSGGWPMSVFLTPELKPFFAGTYFPPDARYGRPGFPHLLERIAEAWATDRARLRAQGSELVEHLRQGALVAPGGAVGERELRKASAQLSADFDERFGGFGGAPKFPNSAGVLALLREHRRSSDQDALKAALFTLQKMAEGGIYDHLGGGFHRYSTDEEWLVPHFEKMLYDQAQLIRAYLAAWKIEKAPLWERVVRETIGYVLRELRSPEGGLYSTQDADSEGEEGKFFVWTPDEIRSVLKGHPDEDVNDFLKVYDVSDHGNFEHKNILHPVTPVDDETRARFEPLKKALWEAREKRIKPGLDDKVLADWNGLMLHALAEAGTSLQVPEWLDAARGVARFWKDEMRGANGRLQRVWRRGQKHTDALQVDYAALALGYVALYQATFEREWLDHALELLKTMNELFWDPQDGGWFATEATKTDLIARAKSPHDGATPSGNSLGVCASLAAYRLTGDDDLRERAEKTMRLYRENMERQGPAVLVMVGALQEHLEGPPEVALVGKKDDAELAKMLRAVHDRVRKDLRPLTVPAVVVAALDVALASIDHA